MVQRKIDVFYPQKTVLLRRDALRSDRPYRGAVSEREVRQYILDQSGLHFDPQVVKLFLEYIDQK